MLLSSLKHCKRKPIYITQPRNGSYTKEKKVQWTCTKYLKSEKILAFNGFRIMFSGTNIRLLSPFIEHLFASLSSHIPFNTYSHSNLLLPSSTLYREAEMGRDNKYFISPTAHKSHSQPIHMQYSSGNFNIQISSEVW